MKKSFLFLVAALLMFPLLSCDDTDYSEQFLGSWVYTYEYESSEAANGIVTRTTTYRFLQDNEMEVTMVESGFADGDRQLLASGTFSATSDELTTNYTPTVNSINNYYSTMHATKSYTISGNCLTLTTDSEVQKFYKQ